MSEGKRFRDALYGFNKSDVNLYIEKMLKDFDEKMKEKDEEIAHIKSQNRDLRLKYDEASSKIEELNGMKDKISIALVMAQEKADIILQDARLQAYEEKKKIEGMVEMEKEKLVDIRSELRFLKEEVVSTLKKYEVQLGDMMEDGVSQQ